LTAQNTV